MLQQNENTTIRQVLLLLVVLTCSFTSCVKRSDIIINSNEPYGLFEVSEGLFLQKPEGFTEAKSYTGLQIQGYKGSVEVVPGVSKEFFNKTYSENSIKNIGGDINRYQPVVYNENGTGNYIEYYDNSTGRYRHILYVAPADEMPVLLKGFHQFDAKDALTAVLRKCMLSIYISDIKEVLAPWSEPHQLNPLTGAVYFTPSNDADDLSGGYIELLPHYLDEKTAKAVAFETLDKLDENHQGSTYSERPLENGKIHVIQYNGPDGGILIMVTEVENFSESIVLIGYTGEKYNLSDLNTIMTSKLITVN